MDLCIFSESAHQKHPAKRVYVKVTQTSQQTMRAYKVELARRRALHQEKPQFGKMMSKADYVYNS